MVVYNMMKYIKLDNVLFVPYERVGNLLKRREHNKLNKLIFNFELTILDIKNILTINTMKTKYPILNKIYAYYSITNFLMKLAKFTIYKC